MLSDLEKFLLDGERPALLMHFGDHQPSFDGAIHAIPKQVPKEAGPNSSMVTYYSIKTNFPVRRKFDYPVLDIAFLGALVLDVAGVPKDAFYQANTLLRERCKGALPRLQGHEHGRVVSRLRVQHDSGSSRRMNAVAPLTEKTTVRAQRWTERLRKSAQRHGAADAAMLAASTKRAAARSRVRSSWPP